METINKEYRYIYNRHQALFYINNGCKLIEIEPNDKTRNLYFKFIDNDQLQQTYYEWKNRIHN